MSTRKLAEQFIEDQIQIMREHGKAPKLSAARYEEVVSKAEKTFAAMRGPRNPNSENNRTSKQKVVLK